MRGSGKPDRRTVHRRGFLGGATALLAAQLSALEPANPEGVAADSPADRLAAE